MIDDAQLARRLLDHDLVDRARLKEGRQLQLTHGTTLYSALIRHAIVEERVVVDAAASLLNLRCVHLDEMRIDRDVTALLSPTLARQHRVLPIELKRDGKEEQLVLAMEDPLDIMAMDDIATALGINIQPVLVGPVDIDAGLDRAYMERFPSSDELGDGVDFGALSDDNNGRLVEDSWGAFFDDAQSQEVPLEESSIISKEMRDRPSTVHLDDWDIDEVLEDDPISLLDEPSIAHHSEPVDSLADWEIDESIVEGRPAPAVPRLSRSGKGAPKPKPDYGSIGNFYVQNPADDPSLPPPSTELAEEDLEAREPEEHELEDASPSPSREVVAADEALSQKKPLTFEELLEDKPSPEGTYVAGPSQSFTELAEELGLGDLSDPSKAKEEVAESPEEIAPGQDESSVISEVEDSSYTAVASAPHLLSIPTVPPAAQKKDLEEESDDIFDLAISEAIGSGKARADAPSEDSGEEEEEFVLELEDLVEDNEEEAAPEEDASAEEEEEEVILLDEVEEEPEPEEEEEEVELADLVEDEEEDAPDEDQKPGTLGKLKLKRIAVPRVGVIVEKQSHRKKKPAKKAAPEKKPAVSEPEKAPEKKSDPLLSEEDLIKGFQDAFDDFELEPIEAPQQNESLERDPSTREVSPEDLFAANRSVGQEETFATEEPEAIAVEVDREAVKAQESKEAKARRLRSLLNKGRATDDSSDADEAPEDEHVTTEFDTLEAREAQKEEEERSEAGVVPEASSSPSLQGEGDNPNRATAANEALTQEFLQRMRRETAGMGMKSKKDTKPKSTLQAAIGTIPEDLSNSQVLRAAIMLLVAKDIISYEDLLSLARSLPEDE